MAAAKNELATMESFKIVTGISVMDYRGAVKNPGIKVDTKLKLV